MTNSPFKEVAPALNELGYHVIPIIPEAKAPGDYKLGHKGGIVGLYGWNQYRDRRPSQNEITCWMEWDDFGCGVVLGVPDSEGMRLLAVDIDTDDYDQIRDIESALPVSPFVKKGAKGKTMFYRTDRPIPNMAFKSDGKGLADLLIGGGERADARQSVVAGHHPDGGEYRILKGPVPASQLPILDDDHFEQLFEVMETLGWNKVERRPTPQLSSLTPISGGDDHFRETNEAALANLDAWIFDLDLPKLIRRGSGYRAVNPWRSSTSGRSMEERKRNLGLNPIGIEDFGSGEKFTAIDMVIKHLGSTVKEATDWLRDKLGFEDDENLPVIDTSNISVELPPIEPTPERPAPPKVPGLIGDIADWITASARYPQPWLSLGAAISVVSVVCGRQYLGPTGSALNLYILGIAPSGAGKNDPAQAIPALLADCELAGLIGADEYASQSGLLNAMKGAPVQLAVMDEFGSFLQRIMNRKASVHERGITKTLRSLWSVNQGVLSGIAKADTPDAEPIYSPSFSLFGVSTPIEFFNALGGAELENGTLGRFLILSSDDVPAMVRKPSQSIYKPPAHIVSAIKKLYESNYKLDMRSTPNAKQSFQSVEWIDEATGELWFDYAEKSKSRARDGDAAERAILSRKGEMAARLAGLFAVSNGSMIACNDCLDMAATVIDWSMEQAISDVREYMAESDHQAICNDLFTRIRRYSEKKLQPMPWRNLMGNLSGKYDSRTIESAMTTLQEAGKVVVSTKVEGSRAKIDMQVHVSAEHHLKQSAKSV